MGINRKTLGVALLSFGLVMFGLSFYMDMFISNSLATIIAIGGVILIIF